MISVIASEAKQSIEQEKELDCSVASLLAMTGLGQAQGGDDEVDGLDADKGNDDAADAVDHQVAP